MTFMLTAIATWMTWQLSTNLTYPKSVTPPPTVPWLCNKHCLSFQLSLP